MENQRLSALIERAIKNEEEAYEFYMSLHRLVEDQVAKDTLQFLAGEEKKHREFLMAYRDGRRPFSALKMDDAIDYRIAQYVDAPDIQKNMNSIEVYLVAGKNNLLAGCFIPTYLNGHRRKAFDDRMHRAHSIWRSRLVGKVVILVRQSL